MAGPQQGLTRAHRRYPSQLHSFSFHGIAGDTAPHELEYGKAQYDKEFRVKRSGYR
jgi:hypothetical protein